MPKKHHKTAFSKPSSTAHHTLATSGSQNDRFRSVASSSSGREQPSVNDLIQRLRRTQASDDGRSPSRFVSPRSVHPSLRNLLELPETPPPRPRPDSRRVGITGRGLRRTPGPPPPESWFSHDRNVDFDQDDDADITNTDKVIYRLDRLPGRKLPRKNSLLHTLLKSMALHWRWHVEYDGQFLELLPTHIKLVLFSYIAVYARDQPLRGAMQGLSPLIEHPRVNYDGHEQPYAPRGESEITHLDLSGAIGRWITLKQLSSELFVSRKPHPVQSGSNKTIPTSWEDEYNDGVDTTNVTSTSNGQSSITKSPQGLRFQNLQYLSLAYPNPASVNWNSLISLLSRLSTITHLSLAHWPVPTVTPNAIQSRIRNPIQRSMTFAYGGTDSYSAMENNWAEAAGILRRLSRATYCLKWLDLEGCGDWIPALNWEGVGPDGEACPTGPEWNGSWRDIEWMRLGPGWLPAVDDSELLSPSTTERTTPRGPLHSPPLQNLASSIHSPLHSTRDSLLQYPESSSSGASGDLPWDVETERRKYRLSKELDHFREIVRDAKSVQQRILQSRREGRGKWVHFSFGLEDIDDTMLRKLLGSEYSTLYPIK